MKPHFAFFFLFFLLASSLVAGLDSYQTTEKSIETDLRQALRRTLEVHDGDKITADTVRTYRGFITIDALRDRAYLSMKTVRRDGERRLEMVPMSDCSVATVYDMSDQRLSQVLFLMALLWAWLSSGGGRKPRTWAVVPCGAGGRIVSTGASSPAGVADRRIVGGLVYSRRERLFYDTHHCPVHLTPMQHRLMELFFSKDNLRLEKQEICDALWPKKEDASDTLYALVRRLKTVVEPRGRLKIESDRGRAYFISEDFS